MVESISGNQPANMGQVPDATGKPQGTPKKRFDWSSTKKPDDGDYANYKVDQQDFKGYLRESLKQSIPQDGQRAQQRIKRALQGDDG